MTPVLFLVYLPTHIIHPELQTYNPNFMSDFIPMTFYLLALSIPRGTLQKPAAGEIQVGFMVNVDYFLGTSFNWLQNADVKILVHLWQSAFP